MNQISFTGDGKNVTWTDGKKYAIGMKTLTDVLKISPQAVQAALEGGKTLLQIAKDEANRLASALPAFTVLSRADQDKLTPENLVAYLRAEGAYYQAMAAKQSGITSTLTVRVGQKGGISVYGMGKFPITLYAEQWARLFADARGKIETILAAPADTVYKGKDSQSGAEWSTTLKRKGE